MTRALGIADGWGVQACAAALTVGLIFCQLFYQEKSWKRKVGLIFCTLFDHSEKCEEKVGMALASSVRAAIPAS